MKSFVAVALFAIIAVASAGNLLRTAVVGPAPVAYAAAPVYAAAPIVKTHAYAAPIAAPVVASYAAPAYATYAAPAAVVKTHTTYAAAPASVIKTHTYAAPAVVAAPAVAAAPVLV